MSIMIDTKYKYIQKEAAGRVHIALCFVSISPEGGYFYKVIQ